MENIAYPQVLAEFRADIFQRLSIIVAISSLITGLALVFIDPLPHHLVFMLQVFSLFVIFMRHLSSQRPNLARYLFASSLYIILSLSMLMLPVNWLPFLVAPLLLVSELLTSRLTILAGALFVGFAALLVHTGYAVYPLQAIVLFTLFGYGVAHGSLRTIWMLLHWYRSMFERSSILLEETRSHRAELVQTLRSLEIAQDGQQRLQTQLVYARQQADEARRLKERFASNISHELRTPLNIILGFTEIMHITPEIYGAVNFPPKLQQDIYQIHRNSRHLLDMIDDVLDLSHIDMTQFSLNFERTNPQTFLQDTVDLVGHLFKDKPVAFNVKIEENLPEIQIDRTRIRQVIINLLNNAQRFTFTGSVTFSVHAEEKEVIFQVIDTGIGIAENQISLIFEEFFQVDYSLSRSTGGAGLGLAITRRFIEAHNGHLHVESQEGVGSTFTFNLPLPAPLPSNSQLSQKTKDDNQETLWLVIDADPHVSKLIARHTRAASIIPVDGVEHLDEAMRRYSPQGIILNMPTDSTISPDLKNLPIPVVVCSLPSTTQMVMKLGVTACLSKPILPQELIQYLEPYQFVKTILVIDDDVGVVQLVQRVLENSYPHLTIQRAYNGQQACEMMETITPDLVLLDLVMPTGSGFEVITTMKNNPQLQNIPIILLTATQYIFSDDESRGELHIHQKFGLKPMEVLKLLNMITQTINNQ
ncbi:MAG: hybrid sensor histidine kinase/response regulator [Anaerolineae bacterium]|nr:hybrid sensor histidine kinase/response regulator [Anaerolineae bacterium]